MTEIEGSPTADAKAPDEDEKLIGIGVDENKKKGEERPENQKNGLLSIFRTKEKKERKFDENETIDCISKGELQMIYRTCIKDFHNMESKSYF